MCWWETKPQVGILALRIYWVTGKEVCSRKLDHSIALEEYIEFYQRGRQ
jgi:hypothetical protein